MATIVWQGLQSCLESQVVESRTLRLKLSSPKPLLFSQSLELAVKPCSTESKELNEIRFQNPDKGGWSFLQDLSNSSPVEKENVYIHPLMKRSSSKLSEKSLELCTESLGCETGSDISSESSFGFESSISSSSSSETESEEEEVRNSNPNLNQNQQQQQQKPGQILEAKKATNRSFPPPLTTMSGAESLQVRPHREDGRLIIMAVKAPAIRSCLQAERTDGRLRLSFVKDSASNFDSDESREDEEEEEEEEEEAENDAEEEEEEVVEEEEMEEANCDSEIQEEKDTEGNKSNVGGEIGKNEFEIRRRRRRSSSRCKEEKKGLLNWGEPFLVAT